MGVISRLRAFVLFTLGAHSLSKTLTDKGFIPLLVNVTAPPKGVFSVKVLCDRRVQRVTGGTAPKNANLPQ